MRLWQGGVMNLRCIQIGLALAIVLTVLNRTGVMDAELLWTLITAALIFAAVVAAIGLAVEAGERWRARGTGRP
ncbi:MAG: hypothetical protein ACOYLQ_06565 [Hyphomicrobiaceae bacterium]